MIDATSQLTLHPWPSSLGRGDAFFMLKRVHLPMDGFPSVVGIFVAEFHPTQGPRVTYQVPEGFVRSTHSSNASSVPFGAATPSGLSTSSSAALGPLLRGFHSLQPHHAISDSTSGRSTPPIPMRPTSPLTDELHDDSPGPAEPQTLANTLALQRFPSITSNVGSMGTNTKDDESEGSSQLLHLDFDSVTEYVIPKADMCNRLVVVSARRWKLVGHPVMIEDPKYPRNALIFNCCFVFERSADTGCYENIARRVARIFRFVETETEFISRPKQEISVQNILEELLEDLNKYRECRIPIGLQGRSHLGWGR